MKAEERLIADLTAEGPVERQLLGKGLDWGYLLHAARANRVLGMVFDGLSRRGLLESTPEDFREGMEREYLADAVAIRRDLAGTARLAGRMEAAGIPMVVLRGPALGLTVYARPFLRPFSDLDLLVLRDDLHRAKEILRAEGFARVPGTWPDRYFERHHLHLVRLHPQEGLKVELHWALDHPYSLARPDYPALLAGRRKISYNDLRIPVLGPSDRIITLSLHLVKHCPFLAEILPERESLHLLLQGRWLLWLLDLYRVLLTSGQEVDWEEIGDRAREWYLERETATALQAVAAVYDGLMGHGQLIGNFRLSPAAPIPFNWLRGKLFRRQLEYLEKGGRSRRLTRRLFKLRAESVFRPVRLLDLAGCLFPGVSWLKKRYRSPRPVVIPAAVFQAARTSGRLLVNLLDYLYYRYRPW